MFQFPFLLLSIFRLGTSHHRVMCLVPSSIVRVEVDAEHEVAEGAVDVLAAALHGRLVGRVDDVDGHRAGGGDVVGGVEGVEVAVTGADHVGVGADRDHDGCQTWCILRYL